MNLTIKTTPQLTSGTKLGLLTAIVAILTCLWLVLLLVTELPASPIVTLAGRVAVIEERPTLFALNYANAGLLTLACVAMLGSCYIHCRQINRFWATVAVLFVPVYGLANAIVYFSQVFVVPQLLALYHDPPTTVLGETWLRLALHVWPGSAAGFLNALAYAILAIPAITFGLLLARDPYGSRWGGLLLAASGLLSIVALVGFSSGNTFLAIMSPASGFLFLLALITLSVQFLRPPQAAQDSLAPGLPTTISTDQVE